ncbi:MAG: thioredoxin family protein [Burkholderiales bacterium]|nr:thioredoxin family protein [Burkholderiales bacterium]
MPVRELSRYSLEHAIVSNDLVIVEFHATWCANCQAFAPVFESASDAFQDIVFARVDADKDSDLAREFEIKAVPTLMIFRSKIMVFREAGAPPPPILEEIIRQAKSLSMDEVRRDLGSRES